MANGLFPSITDWPFLTKTLMELTEILTAYKLGSVLGWARSRNG